MALWNLSGTTRVSQYQKNIHPLTLIVVINYPYLLSPSTTIHGILRIQSTCSTVFFHNLSDVAREGRAPHADVQIEIEYLMPDLIGTATENWGRKQVSNKFECRPEVVLKSTNPRNEEAVRWSQNTSSS